MSTSDPNQIDAVLSYAQQMHRNGWTAEAYRICALIVQNGIALDPTRSRDIVEAYDELGPEHDLEPHKPLTLLRDGQVFSSLHLTSKLTAHQKRVAFKSGVGFINIETSSQCNRACPYCPNSLYDRRKTNTFFDWPTYEKIVDDLASIDYDRRISLVGLNEPLMHMDDFLARLRLIREKLPKAHLLIFTNGDYLDKDAFQALRDVGVHELKVAMHLSKEKPYDERDILKRVLDKSRELGLNPVLTDFTADKQIEFQLAGTTMAVRLSQENYMTEGHSRGETMTGVGRKMENRTIPCIQPFDNFIVNYKGDVLPCCTTIGATEEIAPCIVGNVKDASIFDIYCGEKLTAWRRSLMVEGEKRHPCATCPENWPGFPANWAEIVTKAFETANAVEAVAETPAAS